jgi:hypothetical protein
MNIGKFDQFSSIAATMYAAGDSTAKIGRSLGIRTETIRLWLNRLGVQMREPKNFQGSLMERFEASYIPEPMSGCWLWLGLVTNDGYGRLKHDYKPLRAHRCAWMLFRGKIPNELHVLHRCDTPLCVNPDHLFLGTHGENMIDKARKGRCNVPSGPEHYKYKPRVS